MNGRSIEEKKTKQQTDRNKKIFGERRFFEKTNIWGNVRLKRFPDFKKESFRKF